MSNQNETQNKTPQPGGNRRGGFMGGPPMGRPVEKAKDFKGSLKRLIRYLKPHRLNLIVVLIFAVLSTSFTIAAPKVTSKATNKLQDAYMARMMLEKLGDAQTKAVDEMNVKMEEAQQKAIDQINDKMADGQKDAVDRISNSMVEAQNKTVDQITTQMTDAQKKAVDAIYDSMASQVYKGVVSGQKTAVSQITGQMAQAQKAMVAQFTQMMQGAQQGTETAPAVDPAIMQAAQELMKLPAIDSVKDPAQKVKTTLSFIEILKKMPATPGQTSGQMSPETLKALEAMLRLPDIDTIKDSDQKVSAIKEFLKLSESMQTASGSTSGSSLQLDQATMDKVLARIPALKPTTTQTSGTKTDVSKESEKAVQDLLKLPMLSSISDPVKKNETLIQLIEIFKKMPDMSSANQDSGSTTKMDPKTLDSLLKLLRLPKLDTLTDPQQKLDGTLELIDIFKSMPASTGTAAPSDNSTTMDPEALDTVQQLLKLPAISSITDPNQKAETVIQMVDLLNRMPEMSDSTDTEKTEQTFDPESLKTIEELLKLPMVSSITDPQKKSEAVLNLVDVFSRMPEIKTDSGEAAGSTTEQMDPKTMATLKEFLQLPKLSTLTDANQRADTVKKFMDLGNEMKDTMPDAPQDTTSDVKLTDEQVDSAIEAIRETNGVYDFHYIGIIVIILIAMYLISAGFSLVMGLVMSGVSQKTVRDLRREVDDKLSRLPLKYFDMHPHGDLLSRVTNDIDTISTTLQQSLTQIITSVISIVGYIIMMLTISPILTLIVVGTLPLYIIATTFIAKKSQKFFAQQQKELGQLSGHVEEMYTGHKIVKAFGHEKESIRKFEEVNNRLYASGWKAQFISGIMFPLMNFISNLGYVLICIVGGIWITKGALKIGDILAFIQYSRSFTMPIIQTANIANIIQSTVACAERVFEVLDEEEEIPDADNAMVIDMPKGQVEFEHVAFRYVEDVPLIEDMNLKVNRGDTIAIVGPTGAGKTTLVNLLMRFYEINAGKIKIDGFDIRDIKRAELRRMFGMVLQDTWLFNGTIKDNIAYGKEGATMDEIIRAAKAAHADHFIRTLPEGYNTILNEEATNISQGQKQLLTIARAILADPTILILDEATSSVDTRTEVLIQKAMANLMKNRTSFVIAHRLSTIRDAEVILVMNHGSIIEQGSHRQLLDKNGFYADLYNSQFTGANLENEVG